MGNVLATIRDKKIGVSLASDSSLIDHYEAEVKTVRRDTSAVSYTWYVRDAS